MVNHRTNRAGASRGLAVLIAPDKFKGSLTAPEAAAAMHAGVLRVIPTASVETLAIADGGEGTVAAVVEAGGTEHRVSVLGPLGQDEVQARWAQLSETAVIEVSQAAGLGLIDQPTPDTALDSSSFGVAQILRDALDHGLRRFVIGLGGSASTDGGAGIVHGMGGRLLDADGEILQEVRGLHRVASVDLSAVDSRWSECHITVATDVQVPLTGDYGAARLFGPQKGADSEVVEELEQRLLRWATVLDKTTGGKPVQWEKAGAAGGMLAGFMALGDVDVQPGVDVVGELLGLEEALEHAAIVFVAEGSLDQQSLHGKGPVAIAEKAAAAGAHVIALAGRLDISPEQLTMNGINQAYSLVDYFGSTAEAMTRAPEGLEELAAQAVRSGLWS